MASKSTFSSISVNTSAGGNRSTMRVNVFPFIRSLGETVHTSENGRMQGWARVHAECDYRAPLRYEDVVEVQLLVREKRPSALSYVFVFRVAGAEVARGALTVVCVAREAGEARMRPVPMPKAISELVEVIVSLICILSQQTIIRLIIYTIIIRITVTYIT